MAIIKSIGTYSLVDGGQLRTFLCDPMHTLRSSGYTFSGIFIPSRIQINGFRPVCTPSQKKVVLAAFLIVIHQTSRLVRDFCHENMNFFSHFMPNALLLLPLIFLSSSPLSTAYPPKECCHLSIHTLPPITKFLQNVFLSFFSFFFGGGVRVCWLG